MMSSWRRTQRLQSCDLSCKACLRADSNGCMACKCWNIAPRFCILSVRSVLCCIHECYSAMVGHDVLVLWLLENGSAHIFGCRRPSCPDCLPKTLTQSHILAQVLPISNSSTSISSQSPLTSITASPWIHQRELRAFLRQSSISSCKNTKKYSNSEKKDPTRNRFAGMPRLCLLLL